MILQRLSQLDHRIGADQPRRLLRLGARQTWLCHSNFVNRGASGLQPWRAFSFAPT